LENRAPKLIENPRSTLFLHGTSTSELTRCTLSDLHALKKPLAIKFSKKNSIHPFEDASTLEFFSEKNNSSMIAFGSHSKKRPHNVTFVRTFSHRVLDMVEVGINPDTFRPMAAFKTVKPGIGMKPLVGFSGAVFDEAGSSYALVKSMLLDFFRGETVQAVNVEGLQHLVHISAAEKTDAEPTPPVHLRVYLIKTLRSGQKLPRVEVEEMGPRIDFQPRRVREADADTMKEALKKPAALQEKTKKNIQTDIIGDKIGRIHTGKQDLDKMQSRKMKGLKKRPAEETDSDKDDGPAKKARN
jgi:ribosome production factor 2